MPEQRTRGAWLWLILIGLLAGFMSGLFGVGGGVMIVPALVLLLRMEPRIAAGTSLAAIVPSSLVGVLSYAIPGAVDWVAAGLLAAGSIVGAQIGSHLLSRVSRPVLQWAFVVFMCAVIVSLFLVVPSREASIGLTPLVIAGIVTLGLVTGILSGLLGIGGGVVVVPMLILLFGSSDLIAKGTSIAMMVPTALSGTIGNTRRRIVDLPAAAVIGLFACTTTALGAVVAANIDPFLANVLFAVFVAIIALRMIVDIVRHRG
ncbi:sulfite exporter TauE/SafE family protein [Okibacterium endophyticum]